MSTDEWNGLNKWPDVRSFFLALTDIQPTFTGFVGHKPGVWFYKLRLAQRKEEVEHISKEWSYSLISLQNKLILLPGEQARCLIPHLTCSRWIIQYWFTGKVLVLEYKTGLSIESEPRRVIIINVNASSGCIKQFISIHLWIPLWLSIFLREPWMDKRPQHKYSSPINDLFNTVKVTFQMDALHEFMTLVHFVCHVRHFFHCSSALLWTIQHF